MDIIQKYLVKYNSRMTHDQSCKKSKCCKQLIYIDLYFYINVNIPDVFQQSIPFAWWRNYDSWWWLWFFCSMWGMRSLGRRLKATAQWRSSKPCLQTLTCKAITHKHTPITVENIPGHLVLSEYHIYNNKVRQRQLQMNAVYV